MAMNSKKQSGGGGAAVAEPPRSPATVSRTTAPRRGGGAELAARYGITEQNLAWRHRFLRLEEADRQLLAELTPWARTVADKVAKELCDWLFTFEPTLQFFEMYCEGTGTTLEQLRQQQEMSESAHFVELFEAAQTGWGLDYFERRLRAGKLRNEIDFPMKWTIASYSELSNLLPKYLKTATKDAAKAIRAERAINKVFNLDQQAAADAFMLNLVESTGYNIDSILTDGDKSECTQEIKASLKSLFDGVTLLATGDISNPALERAECDRAGVGYLGRLAGNLRRFVDEMHHMSAEHDRGDIDVRMRIDQFEGAYQDMARGVNEMVAGHISVKKKAMACVEQIGRGNFDAELEIFPGKKAFINEIVETLRANLRGMIQEMDHMSAEHNKGDIDVVIPIEKFEGSYRKMAQGINDMVVGHITVKKKAMACVEQIGRGNFDAELEIFPGKKAFLNQHRRDTAGEPARHDPGDGSYVGGTQQG